MRATRLVLLALLLAPPALAQSPARLAAAFGEVGLRGPAETGFAPAASGTAVPPGSTLRTGAGTRALLILAGAQIALAEESEVAVLPADGPAVVLARGGIAIVLRDAATLAVATPRGLAELDGPGRFAIEAGDAGQPTRLVAASGKARLATEAGTIPLDAGQAGAVPPQGLARMAPAGPTPALLAWLTGEAPPRAAAPPPAAVLLPVPVPVPAPQTTVVVQESVPYPYPVYGGFIGRPLRPHLPPVPPARPSPPPAHPAPGPSFPPPLMTVIPRRPGAGR